MSKEIGVGVLGYSIGHAHAHAWRDVAEVYYPMKLVPRLVAISGRTKAAVEFEAAKYGYDKVYGDWEKVVKDDDVEIVDNCLPVALHPEPTIMAAELGKTLFCEKPLARRAADAKRMLDAAEKAKVKHMVGYNYRFMPAITLAKQMIDEGKLGKITSFRGSISDDEHELRQPRHPHEVAVRVQRCPDTGRSRTWGRTRSTLLGTWSGRSRRSPPRSLRSSRRGRSPRGRPGRRRSTWTTSPSRR